LKTVGEPDVLHSLKNRLADPHSLETAHGVFGLMSLADWQRWAYKHTDHHLRQFGV
jgi:hypothetical protein